MTGGVTSIDESTMVSHGFLELDTIYAHIGKQISSPPLEMNHLQVETSAVSFQANFIIWSKSQLRSPLLSPWSI